MKTLSLLLVAVMIFTSVPVFACGGGSCGGDKDKKDATVMCGGDRDKTPAPAPDVMCGGSGSGCDKDKEKEA